MPILNWLGRDEALKAAAKTPYKLLEEVPELCYGDKNTENMLIQGDNLEALKALLPFYAGQVKCIYIDPPYNTGSAFEHYDDNLEHSVWLSMMYPRLELLKEFLRDDGAIFVSIDDNEQAYLKVIMDEIFGRKNFITNISIAVSPPNGVKLAHAEKTILKEKELIIVYAKNKNNFRVTPQYKRANSWDRHFNKFIDNKSQDISMWSVVPLKDKIGDMEQSFENKKFMDFVSKHAEEIFQPVGNASYKANPQYCQDKIVFVDKNYMAYQGKQVQLLKNSMKKIDGEYTLARLITDAWTDINFNNLFQEGSVDFKNSKKPEALIKRILLMLTSENDIVMDSFLGSGTTCAVAHKMGRRYIGIEMGEHAKTLCVPRLKAVIEGEQGGISKAVTWNGGGGFRFYRLGSEIFDADGFINENITYENLSAHIWFTETKTPFNKPAKKSTYLGTYEDTAYALLYNGILRDKRVDGGNVLTNKTLDIILDDMKHTPYEKLVIYGESSRISTNRLKELNIEFKQTPYDIKAR